MFNKNDVVIGRYGCALRDTGDDDALCVVILGSSKM